MWEEIKGLLGIAKAASPVAKKMFGSPVRQVRGMIDADKAAKNEGYIIQWKRGNIDAITREAVNGMSSDNPQENAEKIRNLPPDWAIRVREAAENTSEPYMQSLWAKILGGEAERPGSFSKQTISIVKNMSQKDAQMFIDFCQFVWFNDKERNMPLVYNFFDEIYPDTRRFFEVLQQMVHLRLVSYDSTLGYVSMFSAPSVVWVYHGASVHLNIPLGQTEPFKGKYLMKAGYTMFTEAGRQLYRICKPPKNAAFFQYILEKWRELGYNPVVQKKGAEE